MKRQSSALRFLVGLWVAAFMVSVIPAYAQLGSLQGRVVDADGKPVPDAEVKLAYSGEMNYNFTVKTDAQGRWTRAGLMSVGGRWTITAQKGKATGFVSNFEVPLNAAAAVPDIVIREGATAPSGDMSAEEAAARNKQAAELKKLFDEVNAALASNSFDVALTKLTEATTKVTNCATCYLRMGDVYVKQKDLAKAEESYKKAIELDAKSAEAYDGLAAVYNTQGKLDLAADASTKAIALHGASGGGDATSAYNSGAILVNQGKMAEARAQFERAIQLDPKMAEAHYQLAMTLINDGKFPDAAKALEQYLVLAPTGPNAQMAKDMLPELKKMQ